MSNRSLCRFSLLAAGLVLPPPALGQLQIKAGEETNIKFGVLVQGQAEWVQDPVSEGYAQNLFLRRVRILAGGQIMKNLTFFVETDNPNLGKLAGATKTISSGFILQDAMVSWKLSDEFILDGGLILTGIARNSLQSAASLLAIDYSPYSFLYSAPEQNVVGRDTGFQIHGNPAKKHLEYRIGVWQGARETGGRNSFRGTARLQYNFFDVETGFFYTGTYLGKKKILSIGGGCDFQKDYKSWAGDIFFDYPVGPGAVTAQLDYITYDGGDTFKTLLKQDTFYSEAGYLITSAKVMPYLTYAFKDISGTDTGDETRWQLGLGWYIAGHNMNLKAAYGRIDPKNGKSSNTFTVQLQGFYF